jgi:hypothetical protein
MFQWERLILRSAAFKCWQERKEEFPLQSSKLRRVHEFGVSESLGEGKPTKLFMGPRAPSRISNRFGTHHCVNPPKIRFNPQCSYVSFNMSSYRNLSDSLWFLFSVSAQPNSNKWSLAGPWLNTTYLPMWQKRPSGAIWMPHHKAAVGKPDVRRSLGGDLPLDIQQKAWSLKGTWNLEKLIWRYLELLWSLFSSCHGDISTIFDISQLRCRDVVSSEFMCPLSTEVVCIAWNSIRTIRILRIFGSEGFLKNNSSTGQFGTLW